MPSFFHGVRTTKGEGGQTINTAASGIVFAVGTAPVNQVSSYPAIVLANSYAEAVEQLGYSDDWNTYTLCEVIYSHFKMSAIAPLLLVNVADPATAKQAVSEASKSIVSGQVELPETAIKNSIVVKNGETALVAGTDYDVFYADGKCYVEAINGGAMESLSTVKVAYDSFTFTAANMKTAVIGGYDTTTGQNKGLELVNDCYATYQVNPDIIIAPGFSSDPQVAAAMAAKCENLNSVFHARTLVDADCATVRVYSGVPSWKNSNGINSEKQIVCWPMAKTGDKIMHLSSRIAAIMTTVDSRNDDCPSESPDNKDIGISGLCLADGTDVVMNLERANYLNANGIMTALNFVGGFKAWGSHTACFPGETDPTKYFIPVARMFDWVGNSLILTYWSRIGEKLNRRLCESIADSASIWMNSLTAAGHIYGGRVEFNESENTDVDIMAGILRPHIYMAPVSPLVEVDWIEEYDSSYVSNALAS
ncbi:MAG: phage tail protein [Oscillospiraceae bacterium]|nr:phage tail protein [Oscillospiraceae bacterium]